MLNPIPIHQFIFCGIHRNSNALKGATIVRLSIDTCRCLRWWRELQSVRFLSAASKIRLVTNGHGPVSSMQRGLERPELDVSVVSIIYRRLPNYQSMSRSFITHNTHDGLTEILCTQQRPSGSPKGASRLAAPHLNSNRRVRPAFVTKHGRSRASPWRKIASQGGRWPIV